MLSSCALSLILMPPTGAARIFPLFLLQPQVFTNTLMAAKLVVISSHTETAAL